MSIAAPWSKIGILVVATCTVLNLLAPNRSRIEWGIGLVAASEPEATAETGGAGARNFSKRRKAPGLDGGVEWINVDGPIELKQLHGKFVLLDFWTYCCINCMHILPVLKELEHTYPNELVVIGVHSAKFETEQDSKNITEAVARYEIEHPVVNDSNHVIWEKYMVSSWPSLRLIDPEGYVIAEHSGEIDFESLNKFLKEAIANYRARGLVNDKPHHFKRDGERSADTPLRFPGKLLADESSGRLFIADSNHNRIVIAKLDGTLVDSVGSGAIGKTDGDYRKATFDHPQGMALDGDILYVADTENHLLRKIDLKKKHVTTVAGTGKQGTGWPGMDRLLAGDRPERWVGKPHKTALNSPWALWIHDKDLYIAMAGPHQIWKMPLTHAEIGPYAGNSREDIVDGPLLPPEPFQQGFASFAQPSGLTSDGQWLYVADSEGSSIRAVPFDTSQNVRTLVGTSGLPTGRLFTFGDVDGRGLQVRLQHPLDVAFGKELLYVADTYNNKIKVIDPTTGNCKTLVGSLKPGASNSPVLFDEPAGLSLAGDKLYVADTNNHLIRVIDLANDNQTTTLEIAGLKSPESPKKASRPSFKGAAQEKLQPITVKARDNQLQLRVNLKLPEGYEINQLAPLRYYVDAVAGAKLVEKSALGKAIDPEKRESVFDIHLPLTQTTGEETLKLSLAYYYCQKGNDGLCKTGEVVWTVPVKISPDAEEGVVELTHDVGLVK